MSSGTHEATWQAVQQQVGSGNVNPQLSQSAQDLVKAKVQIIRAWADHQQLDFRNENDKQKKRDEFLNKIWKWLLHELKMTDDGTGFTTP